MGAGAGPAVLGLVALLALWPCAKAGCAEEGRCCPGRDPTCASTGWRLSRAYGTCFCDAACKRTGDCCYDYAQACPALPCIVGEWTPWSGCPEQCKPNFRMRTRVIQQEPKNGGDPCPPLEEKAGCMEYTNYQGQDCANEHVPAFITTSEYNKERQKQAVHPRWSSVTEDSRSYCVEFRTETLSPRCSVENRPYARWMQYLREGYTVCVTCQSPAMHTGTHRCSGDGGHADGNKVLQWQAVGNPLCHGTWKKVQQMEECSCPLVHSFIFT
ncbi:somatomedin-B and thrombospondin type-1 domain-containing protein [Eublepharis macularius]|uniref:Somatomedin-B and thrombospondin type-1 domain-containing protein n=1 Tax=Eublepharis macularius TaxID=481883 RepID=A0AA97L3R5_EUBMA|nr:somatomedin-B and thrombospondin type-1 domain-containing protein [Eublepharis macularius]